MPHVLNRTYRLLANLYNTAEKAVTGHVIPVVPDPREQLNIKLIFDYLFFNILLVIPTVFFAMLVQNTTDLLLAPFSLVTYLLCLLLLKQRAPTEITGTLAALSTLALPILSSFFNSQDTSPRYAMIWVLSLLFCYIVTNLATTLLLGGLLCSYLVLVAWIELEHVAVTGSPGYTPEENSVAMPVLTGLYILFLIRVLGRHYRNIMILEQQRTLQKQKQHSSLLNQHLTKQFIILKGLSRSGKSKYLAGNMELLEACFVEIEKQCETAIDYLDKDPGQQPESRPGT